GLTHRHRHSGAQAEIAAWVAWLQARGAGAITLLGHSRGGNQAAIYGRTRPHEAVRRLVLIAPSTWTFEKAAKSYARRSKVPLSDLLARADKLIAEGRGDQLLEDVPFLHCPKARVAAATFAAYYAPKSDSFTPGLLPSVEPPVLVISGSADTVVPDLAEALQRLAPSKKITMQVIEDADHFFRDLFAEDVADAIAAFHKAPD
ncbi:MAG: alpha/beta hydrolase, partial [Methyloligellaceae bacterium]